MKRLKYIDRTRGVAIITIVLGHLFAIISAGKTDMDMALYVRFFSIYEIPLCFIVSGYLFFCTDAINCTIAKFIKKRVKSLLIPYFAFSFIYIIFNILINLYYHYDFITVTKKLVIYTLTGYGISALWFLTALFLGEIAFFLMVQKFPTPIIGICIVFPAALLFRLKNNMLAVEGSIWMQSMQMLILNYILVAFMRGIIALLFISIGYYSAILLRKICVPVKWMLVTFFIISGTVSSWRISTVDIRFLQISKPVLWILSAVQLSIGILLFFQLTEKILFGILEFFGKNSLVIMCTHIEFTIPETCIKIAEFFVSISAHGKNYIFWAAICMAMTIIELTCIFIFNKLSGALTKYIKQND